ncbi:sigma-70 family RNA polymerase sigma factor [Actinoplanes sp. NPDC023936]|uniref:RNA polymerase sigma factor n=1 Tax=Actinoplanes sp. NPDC023936 TaxID=3154910 RepID=UPI0033FBE2E3
MIDRVARDARLVVRAQLGDRRALAELVGHWHEPLWRYVRRMTPNADDVTQQAWAAALGSLPRLREPERFAPWLFTIARRAVMNQLRQGYGSPDPLESDLPDGRDPLAGVLDRAQIAEGLDGLPPPEREVIELFHLQDLSLQECAEILAVPVGTVKSRLHRARRLLRDHLIAKGYAS